MLLSPLDAVLTWQQLVADLVALSVEQPLDPPMFLQLVTLSLRAMPGVARGELWLPGEHGFERAATAGLAEHHGPGLTGGPPSPAFDLAEPTLRPAADPGQVTLTVPVRVQGKLCAALQLTGSGPALEALWPAMRGYASTVALWHQAAARERASRADQRELALLGRAMQVLDPAQPQADPLQAIMDAVHDLFEVEHVGIGLIEDGRLRVRHAAGPGHWHETYPLDEGVSGQVARSGVAALVEDVAGDPRYVMAQPGVVSEICVPLLDGERVVGVLNVESEARRLGEADLPPLLRLGAWLGRALERERLYAATERQRAALDLLHSLRSAFGQATEADAAFVAVTGGLREAFGYSHVSVYRRVGDALELQQQVGYAQVIARLPLRAGVMGRTVRRGEAQWVPELARDPDAVMAVEAVTSEVCVPLWVDGQVTGVLNVETVGDGPRLDAWDANLIGAVGAHLQEVLERLALQGRVREREALFQLLAEHAGDLICLHGPDGHLDYVSPSAQALLGRAAETMQGRPPGPWIHPADWPVLAAAARRLDRQPQRFRARHTDGHELVLECTLSPVAGGGRFVSSTRDVSARHAAEAALARAAHHDALTGLANRAQFLARLTQVIVRVQVTGRPRHAVLYLDLNGFKAVNDTHGHAAGDALLVEVARRLQAEVRPGDLVARLGGDEFAVLLDDVPLPRDGEVRRVTARLQRAVARPVQVAGQLVVVSVSVGAALGAAHHRTPEEVVRDADRRMYRAKRDRSGGAGGAVTPPVVLARRRVRVRRAARQL